MSLKLSPYLNFNGNTKEAMEFYKSVLGGELEMQTFKEAAETGMECPPGYEDKIVHAKLDADGITIMASEGEPDNPTKFGDNVSLSLNGGSDDEDRLRRIFDQLSDGGEVTMPLDKQFWGDLFGMCKDKFGVYWMVNVAKPAAE